MYDPHSIYRGKYREFIDSILTKRPHNKYFENSSCHHVIPSCCEGVDNDEDNIRIYLHHREHFIAHKILAEENPENYKLVYAYMRMCNGRVTQATPEEYEEARILMSDSQKGRRLSEDIKSRISLTVSNSIRGENNPMYGKKHSEESRAKNRNSHLGMKHTEESKRKISESMRGKKMSEISRKNNSESHKGLLYNLYCKSCNQRFLGKSPTQKYCSSCKGEVL